MGNLETHMKTIRPFLLAVVIVTFAFTPFGFWGWLLKLIERSFQ